jgi:hypothetical protein
MTEVLQTLGLLEELFKTAHEALSERDYQVLNLRYGLDGKKSQTLNSIGKKLKISRERVRQVAKISILRTRSAFRRKLYVAALTVPASQIPSNVRLLHERSAKKTVAAFSLISPNKKEATK